MNTSTLPALGALLLGTTLASAAPAKAPETSAPAATAAKDPFVFSKWAQSRFAWFDAKRDNAANPWIQDFNVSLRMQYQWSNLDPAGGEDRIKGGSKGDGRRWNDEWRRFRMGVNFKFLEKFKFVNVWNIGGMDGRYQYKDGWDRSSNTYSLYELYTEYNAGQATFGLGKMKPAYFGEYRTSSSAILTIERSALVNQLRAETNYGISARSTDKNAKIGWQLGMYLNGNGHNNLTEPGFNTGDNCFVGGTLSYDTSKMTFLDKSRLYLDYAHNFTRLDTYGKTGRNIPDRFTYQGIGAVDMIGLTWEGTRGNFYLMTEVMAGFNLVNLDAGKSKGAQNVFGVTIMPAYKFTPHWEGVFRYQLATGSNAVVVDKRYYSTNSNYSAVSDCLQGFYLGANYYLFPDNPNMMKVMAGVEYLSSNGTDAKGAKGYTGWSYSVAVRTNF